MYDFEVEVQLLAVPSPSLGVLATWREAVSSRPSMPRMRAGLNSPRNWR